jgi:hypothetical protein
MLVFEVLEFLANSAYAAAEHVRGQRGTTLQRSGGMMVWRDGVFLNSARIVPCGCDAVRLTVNLYTPTQVSPQRLSRLGFTKEQRTELRGSGNLARYADQRLKLELSIHPEECALLSPEWFWSWVNARVEGAEPPSPFPVSRSLREDYVWSCRANTLRSASMAGVQMAGVHVAL